MLSSDRLLELFIVFCITDLYRYLLSKSRFAFAHAQAKSGPVRPDTVPTGLWGTPFTALQAVVCFLIPAIYVVAVVGAGLQQPSWMNALALPELVWKNALRVLASIASISVKRVLKDVFEHLSDQYHPIGRREKPRIVQTGPYALVRHPLYTVMLFQTFFLSLAFWSYAPLFVLVPAVAILAIKIPMEEETIQRDDATREEYRAYMRKVPARLMPYIW